MNRTKITVSMTEKDMKEFQKLKEYADLELLEDGSIDSILVKATIRKTLQLFEEGKIDSIF